MDFPAIRRHAVLLAEGMQLVAQPRREALDSVAYEVYMCMCMDMDMDMECIY